MFAGHDTTTSALSLTLWLLSRHPEVQKKLVEEIISQFGDDYNRPITSNDLNDMVYMTCVIKESLRLFPPIPAISRGLEDNLQIGE